jgi:hypothetical protein
MSSLRQCRELPQGFRFCRYLFNLFDTLQLLEMHSLHQLRTRVKLAYLVDKKRQIN